MNDRRYLDPAPMLAEMRDIQSQILLSAKAESYARGRRQGQRDVLVVVCFLFIAMALALVF